jgi:hypothetical protein
LLAPESFTAFSEEIRLIYFFEEFALFSCHDADSAQIGG